MDENAKVMKSVMILNIITVVVVVVLLGLQVYQMVTTKSPVIPPIDQQKQTQKPSDSTGVSQNQQQNQQNAPTMQQQSGTMPTGQQAPMGGQQSIKCGDNVCDTNETADPNLCPKDCGK